MGHWLWPMTHATHPKMVTHLTHDPRPTDPFPSLVPTMTSVNAVGASHLCCRMQPTDQHSTLPESRAISMSLSRAVSVEWCGRYANWRWCLSIPLLNRQAGRRTAVCALRGFPWTVTICDKWHHRPHDHKFRNICCPEIWSFEIFQDGGRPNLAFDTTGSRSIQSAVPENPTLGSNTKLIGRTVPEIWPFEIFEDGGPPPSWIWCHRK